MLTLNSNNVDYNIYFFDTKEKERHSISKKILKDFDRKKNLPCNFKEISKYHGVQSLISFKYILLDRVRCSS